jgi:site-specific recombinase XerD
MIVLTQDETRRLIAAVDRTEIWGARNYWLLVFLFNTGLRVSELVFLNIEHVAEAGRVRDILHLPSTATKYRRTRLVPLNENASRAVAALLAWNAKFGFSVDSGSPLFVTRKHTRMSDRSVQALFADLRSKAGLDVQATPHGARHTMATTALACGGNVRALQTVLGHKRLASTEVYTHVNRDELKRTVDRVQIA